MTSFTLEISGMADSYSYSFSELKMSAWLLAVHSVCCIFSLSTLPNLFPHYDILLFTRIPFLVACCHDAQDLEIGDTGSSDMLALRELFQFRENCSFLKSVLSQIWKPKNFKSLKVSIYDLFSKKRTNSFNCVKYPCKYIPSIHLSSLDLASKVHSKGLGFQRCTGFRPLVCSQALLPKFSFESS